MTKILSITVALLVGVSSLAFACAEHANGKMKCHKCMMMKKQANMVATSDGGVVLLKGNSLAKYDKNLKLVKEVELPASDKCLKCKEMKGKHEGSAAPVAGHEGKAEHKDHGK